jgi:SAM-dependent methyltransferase
MAATDEAPPGARDKVSQHWGMTLHEVELTYYGFPPLRPYLYRAVTGEDPAGALPRDWFERWAVEHVLGERAPMPRCLSLCCGFGEIERILARLGAFEHCRAIDLAAPAVEAARAAAAAERLTQIDYDVVDVESVELEPESVDLVWANGALHHLSRLEHVLSEVHRALRPDGILIANEYVGPNHAQLGERESELVNAVIHLIPPSLRDQTEESFVPARFKGPRWLELAYRGLTGRLPDRPSLPGWQRRLAAGRRRLSLPRPRRFGPVWDNNPWYYEHVDPSEGVRAAEIVPVLESVFGEVDVRYYNGSILPHALDRGFYERFDPADELHVRLLDILVRLESGLVASGQIEPHHAALVARKAA